MIKRLLKRIFSKKSLSILIAVMFMCLSLFFASQINITKDTGILTGILATIPIFIFLASLLFICFIIKPIDEEDIKNKEE